MGTALLNPSDNSGSPVEGRAAMILLAALIDSLERVAPGTIAHIDSYMVEALERKSIDRDALTIARNMLAGLREAN